MNGLHNGIYNGLLNGLEQGLMDNNVGNGVSSSEILSGFDPDALRYLNAANIGDANQRWAIDLFVKGLKIDNLWAKCLGYAIYPLVGGTASSHKYNLMLPEDTDAAFRLTYTGGLTHISEGVRFSGVNPLINSNMPSGYLSRNSSSLGVYSRTSGNSAGAEIAFGTAGSPKLNLIIQYTNGNTYFDLNNTYLSTAVALSTVSTGLYVSSRTASNDIKLYRRGVLVNSQTDASVAPTVGGLVRMGALGGGGYSTRTISYYHLLPGLSQQEVVALDTLVQQLQVRLGRNIY